jgi:hypothetical protein
MAITPTKESAMKMEKFRALAAELARDEALARGEAEQRNRVEKFGSIEQEKAALKSAKKPNARKAKDFDMDR